MLHGTHYCPIPLSPYVTIDLKRLDLKKEHAFYSTFPCPKVSHFLFRTPTETGLNLLYWKASKNPCGVSFLKIRDHEGAPKSLRKDF